MKKKVVALGKSDMTLGFSLAGIDDSIDPEDEYEAKKTLDRLVESPDIGVILLSETLAEEIREKLDRISRKKELYPVIVEIPDKEGPLEEIEDPLEGKIRRAIGVDVSSQEE